MLPVRELLNRHAYCGICSLANVLRYFRTKAIMIFRKMDLSYTDMGPPDPCESEYRGVVLENRF